MSLRLFLHRALQLFSSSPPPPLKNVLLKISCFPPSSTNTELQHHLDLVKHGSFVHTCTCINGSHIVTRAVRHRIEVSAPVLFFWFFLVHVVLKYASLNGMRLRPGYVPFEFLKINMAASAVLNDWNTIKWEFSCKKVIRKGLKSTRSLLLGIRSLQGNTIFRWFGTNKYRRPGKEQLTKLFTSGQRSVISLAAAESVSSLTEKKKLERCVGTTESNLHGQSRLSLEQQLYYLIMRVFWSKRRVHASFAVGFVFKSWSDSTPSAELDFNSWVFRSLECFRMVQSQWFCLLA